jgi:hypothetical protein
MPRNLSGTYTLPSGNPVTAGTTITTTWANNTLNDIATALTQSVSKDGQTTWTGDMVAGNNKITGLADGSAADDSATIGQVQGNTFAMLGAVSGADTITATASPPITAYATGQTFRFVSAGANTGAVTLALNGMTAKAVTKTGTTALAAGDIPSGAVVEVIYDGTQFQMLGLAPTGSPTFAGTVTITGGTTFTGTAHAATSATTALPTLTYTNTTADAASGSVTYRKSRTAGDTLSSDVLWTEYAQGYANSAYRTAAQVQYIQDAAISGSTVPAAIVFSTQAAGGSLNENLRIDSTGVILAAGSTAPTNYTSRGDLVLPAGRAVRAQNCAKAWVTFDGTAGSPTAADSFGVTSITKHATGDYTINFAANIFSNANYCAVGTAGSTSGSGFFTFRGPVGTAPTATAYRFRVSDSAPNYLDVNHICIAFFGD